MFQWNGYLAGIHRSLAHKVWILKSIVCLRRWHLFQVIIIEHISICQQYLLSFWQIWRFSLTFFKVLGLRRIKLLGFCWLHISVAVYKLGNELDSSNKSWIYECHIRNVNTVWMNKAYSECLLQLKEKKHRAINSIWISDIVQYFYKGFTAQTAIMKVKQLSLRMHIHISKYNAL